MSKLLGVASEWYDPMRMEVYDVPDVVEGTPYTIVLRAKWWHPLLWVLAVKSVSRVVMRSLRTGRWG